MKKIVITGFIIALCMLVIPLMFAKSGESARPTAAKALNVAKRDEAPQKSEAENTAEFFRVKIGDKVENLPADGYLFGVLAAEISPSSEPEALKAQCVAAYSFALYRKKSQQNADYDLTDSYKTDQSYLSESALKEKWGDSYGENAGKIKAAVSAVAGQYLSYGGEPALALYHSLSGGKTNACADVFGSDLPYLVSVESESDVLSPNYKSVFSFSEDELNKKLAEIKTASGGDLFSGAQVAKSGAVKEIKFAGVSISGTKLSGLLGLPSPNFTVTYGAGAYTFTCFGRGHGVGMSQYGAQQAALSGADWREILSHYYPGAELREN